MDSTTAVILILIMLTFSGLFSATETAFSSANKIRLKNLASQGDKRAARALELANSFDKVITAILIGNNVVNIASSSIGTVLFTKIFPENGVLISTAIMTLLVLTFGEILPKSIAKQNAERLSLVMATPLSGLLTLLSPLVFVFSKLASFVGNLFKTGSDEPSVTEDELKHIIEEIEEEGVLESQESDLVRSALEFDEIKLDKILIPRVHVVAIDKNTPIDEIREVFLSEMYSRLPVYDKTIDNIIGIITEKDFFRMLIEHKSDISELVQEVIYFSEFKPINEAMREMQREKTHLAVVVDQHGGTKGIVTLEDIIEELVGEIYDESDEVEEPMKKIGDDMYEIDAELAVEDMLERLDIAENSVECASTTVGGWVIDLFGYIPKKNETVSSGAFNFTVCDSSEHKINKLRLAINTAGDDDAVDG